MATTDAVKRQQSFVREDAFVPLIKKCAILSMGNALDQLYAGKCDECGTIGFASDYANNSAWLPKSTKVIRSAREFS